MKILILALTLLTLTANAGSDPFNHQLRSHKAIITDFNGDEVERHGTFQYMLTVFKNEAQKMVIHFSADKDIYKASSKLFSRKLYKHLFGAIHIVSDEEISKHEEDLSVLAPFPCGDITVGTGEQKYINETTYSIVASGDGFYDTCYNHGGPGAWHYSVVTEFDNVTRVGTFTIEKYEE